MQDIDFYERILGLEEPWRVEEVALNVKDTRVDIHLAHPTGVTWRCPHGERELTCHDHTPRRVALTRGACQWGWHPTKSH